MDQLFLKSLNKSLDQILEDQNTYLIGEDLKDPYGGAFKVSKNLSTKHPKKVISTPISEAAITGLSSGLILNGNNVILEIMFGDFSTLILDQLLNGYSKFLELKDIDQTAGNFLIRLPVGAYRGYGPTHSQSLESIFFHIPNLEIFSSSLFDDPGLLLKYLNKNNKFSIFLEHKINYGKKLIGEKYNNINLIKKDFKNFSKIRIHSKKIEFTLISYGYTSEICLEALQKFFLETEINGELIIVKKIKPIDCEVFKNIESKNIIIVEEGIKEFGWGTYILSKLINKLYQKNIRIIGMEEMMIPSSISKEKEMLVNEQTINKELKDIFL